MENLFVIGIYIAVTFALFKFCDSKFIKKIDPATISRDLIRDTVIVYLATVAGIYGAIQIGGIIMGGGQGKSKSVFVGMPDF
jgi:hypothetical protein